MAEISGELPQASQDQQRLCADLDAFGYCLVADAIPKATLEEMHTRVREQAEEERSRGLTPLDDVQTTSGEDGNQYVYMLINKGRIFQELLRQPRIHSLIGHVLGEQYLLSDLGAIITHPSNRQMGMHIDQWFLPTPTRPKRLERRSGSITRGNLHTGSPDINPDLINAPVVCNVLWMISDFTIDNGATRAVPGSHLSGCSPDPSNPPRDRQSDRAGGYCHCLRGSNLARGRLQSQHRAPLRHHHLLLRSHAAADGKLHLRHPA